MAPTNPMPTDFPEKVQRAVGVIHCLEMRHGVKIRMTDEGLTVLFHWCDWPILPNGVVWQQVAGRFRWLVDEFEIGFLEPEARAIYALITDKTAA